MLECPRVSLSFLRTVKRFFVLDRGNVADRFQKAMVVEPPDPLEGGELDILDVAPRTSFSDDLRS